MENEKYNGWSNRDTWLVLWWLNNDYNNYKRLEHLKNGVGTKKLEEFTDIELYDKLKTFNYGDPINWNNVNISDIRKAIMEEE